MFLLGNLVLTTDEMVTWLYAIEVHMRAVPATPNQSMQLSRPDESLRVAIYKNNRYIYPVMSVLEELGIVDAVKVRSTRLSHRVVGYRWRGPAYVSLPSADPALAHKRSLALEVSAKSKSLHDELKQVRTVQPRASSSTGSSQLSQRLDSGTGCAALSSDAAPAAQPGVSSTRTQVPHDDGDGKPHTAYGSRQHSPCVAQLTAVAEHSARFTSSCNSQAASSPAEDGLNTGIGVKRAPNTNVHDLRTAGCTHVASDGRGELLPSMHTRFGTVKRQCTHPDPATADADMQSLQCNTVQQIDFSTSRTHETELTSKQVTPFPTPACPPPTFLVANAAYAATQPHDDFPLLPTSMRAMCDEVVPTLRTRADCAHAAVAVVAPDAGLQAPAASLSYLVSPIHNATSGSAHAPWFNGPHYLMSPYAHARATAPWAASAPLHSSCFLPALIPSIISRAPPAHGAMTIAPSQYLSASHLPT
ncbi:MAG: hypothetical protein EOO65_03240, partial [Methanosarcinales archaeon]